MWYFRYFVFIIIVIGAYIASFSVQREADSQPGVTGIDSIEELVKEDDMKFGIQFLKKYKIVTTYKVLTHQKKLIGIIAGGATEAFFKVSIQNKKI